MKYSPRVERRRRSRRRMRERRRWKRRRRILFVSSTAQGQRRKIWTRLLGSEAVGLFFFFPSRLQLRTPLATSSLYNSRDERRECLPPHKVRFYSPSPGIFPLSCFPVASPSPPRPAPQPPNPPLYSSHLQTELPGCIKDSTRHRRRHTQTATARQGVNSRLLHDIYLGSLCSRRPCITCG